MLTCCRHYEYDGEPVLQTEKTTAAVGYVWHHCPHSYCLDQLPNVDNVQNVDNVHNIENVQQCDC